MASAKTNAQMLVCLKAYNKVARETKAKKEGFTSAAQMIAHLEGQIHLGKGALPFISPTATASQKSPCPTTTRPPSATKVKTKVTATSSTLVNPMIHVVDVLDCSGSMYGAKLNAALKGINRGISELKKDTAAVEYTYTLCDFSDDILFPFVKTSLRSLGEIERETRGSTALFDAIGKTIEIVKPTNLSDHKVLVNIYTDGQENSSRYFTGEAIRTLIETLSEIGWTFTFIGTAQDVAYAQARLAFKASNTLVYDGTADGLEKSFVTNTASRSMYSKKVSLGEDVSEGFYKDID